MKRRSVALALFISIAVVVAQLAAFAQTPTPSPTPSPKPLPPGHVILIGFGPGGHNFMMQPGLRQEARRAAAGDYDPGHVVVSKDARGYEYFQQDADGLALFNTVRHIYVTVPQSAENQAASKPLTTDYSLVFVKRRPVAGSKQKPSYCWVAMVDPRIPNPFKDDHNRSTGSGPHSKSGFYEITSADGATAIVTNYPLLYTSRSDAPPDCSLKNP